LPTGMGEQGKNKPDVSANSILRCSRSSKAQ
jgi:hypothetical protein